MAGVAFPSFITLTMEENRYIEGSSLFLFLLHIAVKGHILSFIPEEYFEGFLYHCNDIIPIFPHAVSPEKRASCQIGYILE